MNRSQKLNYLLLGLLVGVLGMWALTATTQEAEAAAGCTADKKGSMSSTNADGSFKPGWRPFAVDDGTVWVTDCK